MKNFVVRKNTPINPNKKNFYFNLINYYNTFNKDDFQYTEDEVYTQAEYVISEYQHSRFPKMPNVEYRILNKEVIDKLTPISHRKANFFKALVAFMDCTLCPKDVNITLNETENDNKLQGIVMLLGNIFDGVNVGFGTISQLDTECADTETNVGLFALVAPKVAETTKKNIEEKNKKKTYHVRVYNHLVYNTDVVAESEEEARKIAQNEADNNSYCYWDCYETWSECE